VFDNVVYLNRDQDVPRKEVTEAQLDKYGIKAARFSAIQEDLQELVHQPLDSLRISFAQASCLVSHLEIIRKYGGSDLLVFEDDVDLTPSEYWGDTLSGILAYLDESIGIAQLSAFPALQPIMPTWWTAGTFGTAAYYIRPWYSKKLIDVGYRDGKWDIFSFKNRYSQILADSVLYSNTPTVSFTLFGLRPLVSTILPDATYVSDAPRFGNSWIEGKNNIEDIKAALPKFKC
jgi:hypothetical protein